MSRSLRRARGRLLAPSLAQATAPVFAPPATAPAMAPAFTRATARAITPAFALGFALAIALGLGAILFAPHAHATTMRPVVSPGTPNAPAAPSNAPAAPSNAPAAAATAPAAAPGAPGAAPPAAAPPEAQDIRDIRGPKAIYPAWIVPAVLAGAALLALGVYGAWRWWRRRRMPRVLLPYEIALQRLEEIRSLMLPATVREFSTAVSDVVRLYIEERFQVTAAHRTTEEFLRDLLGTANLALAQHRPLLAEFLNQCDLAKFAGLSLSVDSMEALRLSARTFVLETAAPAPAPQNGAAPRDGPKPRDGAAPRDGPKPRDGAAPRDGPKPQPGAVSVAPAAANHKEAHDSLPAT